MPSPRRSAARCSRSSSPQPSSERSTTRPRFSRGTGELAPNTFGIELSPTDYERLAPYAASLTTELSELLGQHADEQGYVFAGPVTIELAMAEDLGIGRFRVRSTATARVESDEPLVIPEARPARVFLEVNGTKHPVLPPGLVVGRGSEADLRINDPGVSRKHVEIRLQPGHGAPQIGVVDLDSTNGTFLDGERVVTLARPRRSRAPGGTHHHHCALRGARGCLSSP